jgi:hypothetical protein
MSDSVRNACLTLYSHLQNVDMSAEMASESMEVITMAVDKHAQTKNYEVNQQLEGFQFMLCFT